MKLYAPKYYKDFVCKADKCTHSCCIGWEIDIDTKTLERYSILNEGYGKIIRESIDHRDVPHFKLLDNDRCPHLNSAGLCKIILNVGENYLCDICREHPRFYNYSPLGKEVGIGMSCEEACRLILESDEYDSIIEVGDVDEIDELCDEYNTLQHRNNLYSILKNDSLSYTEKLETIYDTFGVTPASLSDEERRELISSLEYLDSANKELFSSYSSALSPQPAIEKYLERTLAYYVYRHVTPAESEEDFKTSLGFCLFCERLLASVARAANINTLSDVQNYARIISEELEYSEENTDAIKFEFLF